MANLKEVKSRIGSVESTQQITKAMKMVAAAKLRRAQDRIIQLRPYAEKLSAILHNVSSDVDESLVNEYAIERGVENVLLVVITSDRGLCGAFNSNVFKSVTTLIEEKYSKQQEDGKLHLLTIGRRGNEFFLKKGYKVISDFTELFSDLTFNEVSKAAEFAMEGFRSGDFDQVEVVYNEFKNVATQILRTEQFLPIKSVEELDQSMDNIDYIFEPDKGFIIKELIPKSLKIQFFKSLLDSNASEHGARMTAMEKATENAGELLKELRLTYNRTRQAAITTEILEIVAGAEALSGGN